MKLLHQLQLAYIVMMYILSNINCTEGMKVKEVHLERSLSQETAVKNILVFSFPGAKSHIFIFRELLKYVLTQLEEENKQVKYNFHLVVHNSDMNLWTNTEHTIYGYGDVESYDESFAKAMENAREDPVMGYNSFSNAMIHLYKDFLKDGVIEKLRGRKYEVVITDVVNYVAPFLQKELGIHNLMFVNPTCVHTFFQEAFEYNAAYVPLIGSKSAELMNFFERFANHFFLQGTRLMYKYFKFVQSSIFRDAGYDYYMDPFPKDAFFMSQCVNGVHFPIAFPPNFVNLGAVLPRPSSPLTDENIINFLNSYKQNIYVSQGTITKALRLEVILNVFKHFPHIGFIFSLKKDLHSEIGSLPGNVLLLSWAPQNDLLGDERIKAFITHGGLNSVLESLYHAKPMVVIGTTIDQVNSAVLVGYKKYGVSVTRDYEVTYDFFVDGIEKILSDGIYKQNCKIASKLVKESNGKQTFYYWLNYVLENGYDHLLIPALKDYSYIQLYNFDVLFVLFLIIYALFKTLIFLSKFILAVIFKFNKIKDIQNTKDKQE